VQAITAVGKGFVVTETSYGLGQHRSSLSIENYRNFLKYYYLDTAQFFVALATCKISICLFLLRLSQFDRLKRVLWALIGFLVTSHLILFLLVVLQCNPVHKVWDLGTPGRCFSPQKIVNINIVQAGESSRSVNIQVRTGFNPTCASVFSFLTDFICAAFPIVLLRNLKIRRQSYIGLCLLMGLGIITGAIAIARTATTPEIKSPDLSWVGVPNAMTRIFEVNIGNIAACIPILKPFARYVHARFTGRDPHQILNRKASDPDAHERWYRRGWRIPGPSWSRGNSNAYGQQQEPELPSNVMKMRAIALEEASIGTETSRTASIALPMQGIRKGEGDEESIPSMPDSRDSHYWKANGYEGADSGEYFGARNIV